MSVSYSKILLFFIFLLLVSNFMVLRDTLASYSIAAVLFAFVVFYSLIGGKLYSYVFWFDLIPAFFIIAWIYGVYLGVFLGNNLNYVFTNFAGMSLYAIYFVIVSCKIDPKRLVSVIFWAGIINAIYSYAFTFLLLLVEGRSYLETLRLYYSPALSVIGPFLALSLLLSGITSSPMRGLRSKNIFLFLFLFVPYTILPFSKGYFLATVALIALTLFVVFFRLVQKLKISVTGFLFVTIAVTIASALAINFMEELLFTFSVSESSNSVRAEQAPMLISEFTLIGQGLGAELDSNYSRNDLGYGFELSYLSIIHKLGLIGVLICLIYIVCLVIPLFYILFRKENYYSWLAIGGMLFVIPSYGNPMIFGPIIVTLHCCALYFIRQLVLKRSE